MASPPDRQYPYPSCTQQAAEWLRQPRRVLFRRRLFQGHGMISLITNSTCDIPAELVERYHLVVLPFLVIWDGQVYRDRLELSPHDFYRRLRASPSLPTTSFAGLDTFAAAYRSAAESGASTAVIFTIAAALSGENSAARQAAAGAPIPVHLHDSGGTSMGLGWQVLAAARAAEAGGSLGDVLSEAERVRERMRLLVYLDTLDFAYRGGRLDRVSWLIGSALNFKGLVTIDHTTGQVSIVGRAHGRKRALEMLYRDFFAQMGPAEKSHVAVLHGDSEAEAQRLFERVRSEYNPGELLFNTTGPILGSHTGAGALALVGYSD